ncbi:hypothetical protein ACS0TY_025152 [Phlomoides rotata]
MILTRLLQNPGTKHNLELHQIVQSSPRSQRDDMYHFQIDSMGCSVDVVGTSLRCGCFRNKFDTLGHYLDHLVHEQSLLLEHNYLLYFQFHHFAFLDQIGYRYFLDSYVVPQSLNPFSALYVRLRLKSKFSFYQLTGLRSSIERGRRRSAAV